MGSLLGFCSLSRIHLLGLQDTEIFETMQHQEATVAWNRSRNLKPR